MLVLFLGGSERGRVTGGTTASLKPVFSLSCLPRAGAENFQVRIRFMGPVKVFQQLQLESMVNGNRMLGSVMSTF